jgi:hypothetical protein
MPLWQQQTQTCITKVNQRVLTGSPSLLAAAVRPPHCPSAWWQHADKAPHHAPVPRQHSPKATKQTRASTLETALLAHRVSQSAGCCCAGAPLPNAMVATLLTRPRIMPQARDVEAGERENDGEGLYTAGSARQQSTWVKRVYTTGTE